VVTDLMSRMHTLAVQVYVSSTIVKVMLKLRIEAGSHIDTGSQIQVSNLCSMLTVNCKKTSNTLGVLVM